MMNSEVLLVEDEEKTAEMLQKAFETVHINIQWAKDGKEALQIMDKGKYDLIILDLKLPGMSGDEVLEQIRKIDPYVEVIIYTNYQEPPVMKRLMNSGVDGYINKGADADLWQTVEEVRRRLDPLSSEEQDELLTSLPPEMFDR